MNITAPSIAVIEALRDKYLEKHPNASADDFYRFLSEPAPERDIFLRENCESRFVNAGTVVIHQLI